MNDNALDAVNQFTVNVIEGGDRASRSTQRQPALPVSLPVCRAALNQAGNRSHVGTWEARG